MSERLLLGVDIGGTKIAAGLVDPATGGVSFAARVATDAHEGGGRVLARAVALGRQVIAAAGRGPAAVGIGAGGQIDPRTGDVVNATEILPGWKGQRLGAAFADAFQAPAFAQNDVNALALGEVRFGAGRGCRSLAFLALGTGVGGALILDGKLLSGPGGVGGELGHLLLYPPDRTLERCTCGEALQRAHRFALGAPSSLTGPEIADRARRGDEAALAAVEIVGRDLGYGLVSLAHCVAPEKFVIGGGVIEGFGELILSHARATLRHYALPGVAGTPVVAAALGGDAPVVGAACVALERIG